MFRWEMSHWGYKMATIQCSGCDREVNTQSIKCSNCGTPIGYIGGTSVGQERILAAEQAATQRAAEQTTTQRATDSPTTGLESLRAGNYEEAIEPFTRYIASNPNEPFNYRNRAEAYQALGRREEAQADYTRVGRLEKARADLVTRQSLLDRDRESESEDGAGPHMLIGALFFFGGLIATIVTYATAAPGETYYFFWGAMLIGAIEFVRGLAKG